MPDLTPAADRARAARTTAAIMVAVLVAGAIAAAVVIVTRPAPASGTARETVQRDGRQFAVAVNAYDAGGVIEEQARHIAALTDVPVESMPEWIRGSGADISELRARGRGPVVDQLQAVNQRGVAIYDELRGVGFQPSPAVVATFGPLPSDRLSALRANGATLNDLAQYETARRELDSYNAQVQALRSQVLGDLDALGKEPAPGDAPGPNWWALAAILIAVIAIEAALGHRMVRIVRSADDDLKLAADKHGEQVQSMFLVARRITAAGPRGAVAATVAEEAAWTTNADFAVVAVIDRARGDETGRLVPVAAHGDVTPTAVAVGEGVAGRAAEVAHPERGLLSGDPGFAFESATLALLAVPIVAHGNVTGVIVVGRRTEPAITGPDETFTREDGHSLLLLAQVAGTALEHQPVAALSTVPALPPASIPATSRATSESIATIAPSAEKGEAAATASPPDHLGGKANGDADHEGDGVDAARGGGGGRPVGNGDAAADIVAAPATADADEPTPAVVAPSKPEPAPPPSPDDMPAALSATPNVIRALVPDLTVRRNGAPCKLPGASARLLAVLVAQRQPVTVDRLADLLWPEIDLDTGRNRLNVTLHRLRKALDLPADELVVRSSDGVALVPGSGWVIDSWRFWELSNGSTDDQRTAFELYRNDFCSRQLAYEEAVIAERAQLHARWADVTSRLLSEDLVDAAAAADRASANGFDQAGDDLLLESLAAALERAGHSAQAAALTASRN